MAKFGNKKQAEKSIEELEAKYEALRSTYSDLVEANAKALSEVSAAEQANKAKLAELDFSKSKLSAQIIKEEEGANIKISEIRAEVIREQEALDNIKVGHQNALKVIADAATTEANLNAKKVEINQLRSILEGNRVSIEEGAAAVKARQKELDVNIIEHGKKQSALSFWESNLSAQEKALVEMKKSYNSREDELVSRETSLKRAEDACAEERILLEESKKVISSLEKKLSDNAIEQDARGKSLDLKDKELSDTAASLANFKKITDSKAIESQDRAADLSLREKSLSDLDTIVKIRERAVTTAETIIADKQKLLEALDETLKTQMSDYTKKQADFAVEKESILTKERGFNDRAAGLEVRGLELDLLEKKLKAKYALDSLKKDLDK